MTTSGSVVLSGTSYPRWFVPFAVIVGLAGMAGAFVGYDGFRGMTPNETVGWGGVGGCGVAIVAVFLTMRATRREMIVDREGIELRTGFGQPMRVKWSEPHDYYYVAISGAGEPDVDKASIRTSDGRRIDVDEGSIPEHAAMRVPKLVEQYSTKANWPKTEARLKAGEDVEFGPVRVSRERLQVGAVAHSLERPVTLRIEKEVVEVGAEGEWETSSVSVFDVASYPCLLRAIGQITRARAPV